jgi:hypothetical protein
MAVYGEAHFVVVDEAQAFADEVAEQEAVTRRLWLNGMTISTRPQDWAEPARRILRERGAWRDRA